MSACLWFNLVSTPAVMVFPGLSTDLYFILWFNELCWLLDIARKLLLQQKEGMDAFTASIEYMRSTLILDVIAFLPQAASAMNPDFAVLKNVRIY